MIAGLGLGLGRVGRVALTTLALAWPLSRLCALETNDSKPKNPPGESNPKPDSTPLSDPGTSGSSPRIPDAFAPRLGETDDDKDAPMGEAVVLPPKPRPVAATQTVHHSVTADVPPKIDFSVLEIDFDALKVRLLTLSKPKIASESEVTKTEPEVAKETPAAPTGGGDSFYSAIFKIDFARLMTLNSASQKTDEVAAEKLRLPDPFAETRLPDFNASLTDLSLTIETPIVKAGDEAYFTLTGPESYLREASGEFVVGDELGRQLALGSIVFAAAPTNGVSRVFKIIPPIDLLLHSNQYKGGAAALKIHADFSFASPGKKTVKLGADIRVSTAAVPRMKEWDRWVAMTSNPPADGNWLALGDIGIVGGMQIRTSAVRRESLLKGSAPFYVENVTRQMLSRYHTEKDLWQKTISAIGANRNDVRSLAREPSLCSPAFADGFGAEIQRMSEAYATEPPLFFSLASEPSMTRLNAAADFDFSPAALDEFRRWLERDTYGTLQALNEEWQTHFENWQSVVPMTTDDARSRLKDGVGNFAPWADFREFQDYTFSKVLREGADLVRTKIPEAKVGITGAMGPFAFGGWDWSRLANDLDVVEAYDIGGARALWRDLAPGKPALAALTLPADGNPAAAPEIVRTLWQFVLDGGPRGALFWDGPVANSGSTLFNANGESTELGKALAPTLRELNRATGQLLAQSRRADDGVAVLYSPASIRTTWLFESDKLHGTEWLQAWGLDSSAERRESAQLRLRESWGKLLDDCGVGWRFVSSKEVELGELERVLGGIKTLILPRAIALSDREVDSIKAFVAKGGRVVADAVCARFDEHGRLRTRPALDEIFGVNTATEPIFPRPMKALNRITPLPRDKSPMVKWDAEFCANLPPVFSDEPKWLDSERSGKRHGAEFRLSPVFASRGNALYLNLDLTDYLRWRLHPELPRARTTIKAITELMLRDALDGGIVDWSKSKVPHGTQIIRLRTGGGEKPGMLLALRRNPQGRLHELGVEGDGNWAFEKPEPFELHFKADVWRIGMYGVGTGGTQSSGNVEALRKIVGTLDPVNPTILGLQMAEPAKLELSSVAEVDKLQRFEIAVPVPKTGAIAALYLINVVGPDRIQRTHYGGTVLSKDGSLSHVISFALNDPSGQWTISVRDALGGATGELNINVKDAEK